MEARCSLKLRPSSTSPFTDRGLQQFLDLKGIEEILRLGQHSDKRIVETALASLLILAEDGAYCRPWFGESLDH